MPCRDRPGRYLYLRDAETGEYWTNSWSPTQKPLTEQQTLCRHGQGYTRMESRYHDIASEVLYFVPLDDPVEIWQCTVSNSGTRTRTLELFSYCEFGFPYVTSEIALQAILYVAKTSVHDGIISYETRFPAGARARCILPAPRRLPGMIASAKRSSVPGAVRSARWLSSRDDASTPRAPGATRWAACSSCDAWSPANPRNSPSSSARVPRRNAASPCAPVYAGTPRREF